MSSRSTADRTGQGPLVGLRVAVVARAGSAADLTARLLSSHGAEAVAWDSAGTDQLDRLDQLGRVCDVVLMDDDGVISFRDAGMAVDSDSDWAAGTIRCAITLGGLEHASAAADAPVSVDPEHAAQASSGLIDCTGHPGQPPRVIGVPIAAVAAAANAVTSIAALLIRRKTDLSGLMVDISLIECGFAVLSSTHLPVVLTKGLRPPRVGNRHPAFVPWNVYRATDGWVQVCGGGGWEAQCDVFELGDLQADPRFATPQGRFEHGDELDAEIARWCATRTVRDGVAAMTAAGIVAGEISAPSQERLTDLGSPMLLGPGPARRRRPRLVSGERPLAGLKVAEMGAHTAGPLSTRVLAALGATVIKIEPPQGDPARRSSTRMEGGDGYLYELNNIDKHSVVVDVSTPDGLLRLRDLVASADVFVQSLSPGLVEALVPHPYEGGPIRCDISGFPADSPRRLEKAFDAIIQAEVGVMTLTGSAEDPLKAGGSVVDQLSALFAAAGVVLSLVADEPTDVQVSLLSVGRWLSAARTEAERPRTTIIEAPDGHVLVEHSIDAADGSDTGDLGDVSDLGDLGDLGGEGVASAASTRSRSELAADLHAKGLRAIAILGLDEACRVDRVQRLFVDVHDERRSARVLHVPLGLSPHLARSDRPSPAVDQHAAEVLFAWGTKGTP